MEERRQGGVVRDSIPAGASPGAKDGAAHGVDADADDGEGHRGVDRPLRYHGTHQSYPAAHRVRVPPADVPHGVHPIAPFCVRGVLGLGDHTGGGGCGVCVARDRGCGDGVREPVQPQAHEPPRHGRVLRGDAAGDHGAAELVEAGGTVIAFRSFYIVIESLIFTCHRSRRR